MNLKLHSISASASYPSYLLRIFKNTRRKFSIRGNLDTPRSWLAPAASRRPPGILRCISIHFTPNVSLPIAIQPEMVTITTAKGDKLKIVADAWHLEADCESILQLFTKTRLNAMKGHFE
ncbi:hypothetical protein B0H13DRAFT_1657078 [Mycena leptocephala]|nr:hypothetical protein B0H13DRAFT_1657078 [Mycena leptocephala]